MATNVAKFIWGMLVACTLGEMIGDQPEPTTFVFSDFQYKETSKNEMAFREFESACEQSPSCSHMTGLSRVRCVRECISPSCYQDIYQFDQLEEGEIDVRLNSFKGCFVQRSSRPRP